MFAGVGREGPGHHPQQGGLAGAVAAHHAPALAAADGHREAVVDHVPAVRLRDPLQRHHLLARPRRLPEVESHDAAALRQFDLLDLVERLHPALHLRGLRRMRREALDEAALLRQHGLLPCVGGFPVGVADGALPLVEIVVPGVGRDLAVVDFRDPGDHAVHELAIVGRHEQGAGPRVQELLEPDDGLDVEMVRRLVHQQHVGVAEQDAGHRDAHLPAARERADVAVDAIVIEPQAVQHFAGLRLEGVAAEVLVLLLHLAEPREDAVHVARLRRVGHGVLQGLEFVVKRAHAPAAGNRLVEHRAPRHVFDVLAEVADGDLLRDADLALVGLLVAGDHPEQRRLARPVRADQAHLLAGIELERGVDEQQLPAVLLEDGAESNHAGRSSVSRRIQATSGLDRARLEA